MNIDSLRISSDTDSSIQNQEFNSLTILGLGLELDLGLDLKLAPLHRPKVRDLNNYHFPLIQGYTKIRSRGRAARPRSLRAQMGFSATNNEWQSL